MVEMISRRKGSIVATWILAASCLGGAQDKPQQHHPSVNQDSLVIQDFEKRTNDYVKLRKTAQSGLQVPKSKSSASSIKEYQQSLAQNIRSQRSQARPGDIFTPPIGEVFRRLLAGTFKSGDGRKVRASLRGAAPVRGLALQVNEEYPKTSALQSTPPTLLSDLPKLPPDLQYRIVGRELVLMDAAANLVIDFLPDALPVPKNAR